MDCNKEELLLLHGLSGSKEIFDGLLPRVSEDFVASVPTIFGHGSDFSLREVTTEDWLNQLQGLGSPSAVVGVSFGATLSTLLAASVSPKKLVLIAPPFLLRSLFDESFCRVACRLPESLQRLLPEVTRGTTTYPLGAVTRSVKLRLKAIESLSRIKSDVLVLFDTRDHLVEVESVVDIISTKLNVNLTFGLYPGVGHSMLADEDVQKRVAEFLALK